jgi:hypothetical protein
MKAVAPLLAAVLLVAFVTSGVQAQSSKAKRLHGLGPFSIVVEDLDPACKITEGAIETSVRNVLAPTKIRIDPNADDFIYANINFADDCTAANVTLEVDAAVRIQGSGQTGMATVWENALLLGGGSPERMGARALESVAKLARKLADDWNATN